MRTYCPSPDVRTPLYVYLSELSVKDRSKVVELESEGWMCTELEEASEETSGLWLS